MATTTLSPYTDSFVQELMHWYQTAAVGDTTVITVPFHACPVRLIRRPNNHVHWWPPGERGVTISLEDAVRRLEMLHDARPANA